MRSQHRWDVSREESADAGRREERSNGNFDGAVGRFLPDSKSAAEMIGIDVDGFEPFCIDAFDSAVVKMTGVARSIGRGIFVCIQIFLLLCCIIIFIVFLFFPTEVNRLDFFRIIIIIETTIRNGS